MGLVLGIGGGRYITSGDWANATGVPTAVSQLNNDTGFITASGVTYENLNTNGDVGTGDAQVAAGNHDHSGVYQDVADQYLDIGTGLSIVASALINNDRGSIAVATHEATYDHTAYLSFTSEEFGSSVVDDRIITLTIGTATYDINVKKRI